MSYVKNSTMVQEVIFLNASLLMCLIFCILENRSKLLFIEKIVRSESVLNYR